MGECLEAAREALRSLSMGDVEVAHRRYGELSAIARRLEDFEDITSKARAWATEGRLDELHEVLLSYLLPGISYRIAIARSRIKELAAMLDRCGLYEVLSSCPIRLADILRHPKIRGSDQLEKARDLLREERDITKPLGGWRSTAVMSSGRIAAAVKELGQALLSEGLLLGSPSWRPLYQSDQILKDLKAIVLGGLLISHGISSGVPEASIGGLWIVYRRSSRYRKRMAREPYTTTLDEFIAEA